ncbi:Hypothetical protein NTJ_13077 [Nesidiocoris tenuis]|uniref:Right handed beta helix domain-containing protein n=1 Tax=Nesidiocoris tenuis TaxID=355587 RepID=A0ABN7B783_9HEMI|nr:Hypothetical protein NTJ_13077 [Nesidiocoris tenuis]
MNNASDRRWCYWGMGKTRFRSTAQPGVEIFIASETRVVIESVRLSGTGHDYLPTTIGTIVIENCTKVMVASLALEKVTPLRSLTLINIGTIYLDEEAFSWGTSKILEQYSDPGIDVRITNSTIVAIPQYAFKGHLNSVVLDRVKISTVMALAFSNIAGMEKLEITNCAIEAVEQQAFKKFIVGNLKFSGGSIEVMPSYSLTGITVKGSLVMEDMHIGYVRSSAIKVEGPRVFELSNCVIDHLEGDAFRVTTTGPVYINHNSLPDLAYGVFGGISVDPRYVAVAQRQELFFENNTLYRFSDSALLFNTSGLKPKLSHIMIDRPCSCNEFQYWTSKLVKFTTPPNPLRLERAIWCSKGHGLSALVEDEERKNCLTSSVHTTLIMFVILMTLISLLLVCSVGLYFYRRHTKKYMNVPTNDGANNRLSVLSTNSNHIIVIPEGRVYRETELHVVEEHLTPIPPTTVSQHV